MVCLSLWEHWATKRDRTTWTKTAIIVSGRFLPKLTAIASNDFLLLSQQNSIAHDSWLLVDAQSCQPYLLLFATFGFGRVLGARGATELMLTMRCGSATPLCLSGGKVEIPSFLSHDRVCQAWTKGRAMMVAAVAWSRWKWAVPEFCGISMPLPSPATNLPMSEQGDADIPVFGLLGLHWLLAIPKASVFRNLASTKVGPFFDFWSLQAPGSLPWVVLDDSNQELSSDLRRVFDLFFCSLSRLHSCQRKHPCYDSKSIGNVEAGLFGQNHGVCKEVNRTRNVTTRTSVPPSLLVGSCQNGNVRRFDI